MYTEDRVLLIELSNSYQSLTILARSLHYSTMYDALFQCLKDIDKASTFKIQLEALLIEKCPYSKTEFLTLVNQCYLDLVILYIEITHLFYVKFRLFYEIKVTKYD